MGFLKQYYETVDRHRPHTQAGGLTIFDFMRPVYEAGRKDQSAEIYKRKTGNGGKNHANFKG